jgi:7-cyano-7-deazaguanine synthase
MKAALVLLSGGLDSAVCAHLLKRQDFEVQGLFIDYGQAAAVRERAAAGALAQALDIPLTIQAITPSSARGSGELLGRNALLISLGVFALGSTGGIVVIGIHAGTPYYDCSELFLTAMDRLVQEQTDGRIAVSAPLVSWTKADVYKTFQASGLPVTATYSCEAGNEPCGQCLSCLDRKKLGC